MKVTPIPTTKRCYLTAQLLDMLQLAPSTFRKLRRTGQLPFVEEIKPPYGRHKRYRADLVDRYLANQFGVRRA